MEELSVSRLAKLQSVHKAIGHKVNDQTDCSPAANVTQHVWFDDLFDSK